MFSGRKLWTKIWLEPSSLHPENRNMVLFSQNTGNLEDIWLPLFPSVLCIDMVKIHSARPEKERMGEKQGNEGILAYFHCTSLVLPRKLRALLWMLHDGLVQSAHMVGLLNGEGQRAGGEKNDGQGDQDHCGPLLQEAACAGRVE